MASPTKKTMTIRNNRDAKLIEKRQKRLRKAAEKAKK